MEDYATKAPYCPDDELQRLRDLWRPSVQADFIPTIRHGENSGDDWIYRPEGYDSTRTSLDIDYPMYVLPPALAKPVMEDMVELSDDASLFQNTIYDDKRIAGAIRFMRFFGGTAGGRNLTEEELFEAYANFHATGEPRASLINGFDSSPHISMDAPQFERRILYTCDAAGTEVSQSGTLGWTIPTGIKIEGDPDRYRYALSLLRIRTHLVYVNWYDFPSEKLYFNFQLPELNWRGAEKLDEVIASHEDKLPAGTTYDDVYMYHHRWPSGERYLHQNGWTGTDELRRQASERLSALSRHRW